VKLVRNGEKFEWNDCHESIILFELFILYFCVFIFLVMIIYFTINYKM